MNIYKVKKWTVSPEKKKDRQSGDPTGALVRLEKSIASFGQSNTKFTIGRLSRTNSVIKELSLTDLEAKVTEGKLGMTESMSQAFNSNSSFRKLSRKDVQRSMNVSRSRKFTQSPSQSREASFEINPKKIPTANEESFLNKEPRIQGFGLSFARECFHQKLMAECKNLRLTCDLLKVRDSMNYRNEMAESRMQEVNSKMGADLLYRLLKEIKEIVDERVTMAIPTLIDKVDRVLRQASMGVSELCARLVGSGQEYLGWSLDFIWKLIVYCLDGYINWGTIGITESIQKEKQEFQGRNADLLAVIKDKDLKIGVLEERIANLRIEHHEEKAGLSLTIQGLKQTIAEIHAEEERARLLMEEVKKSRMPGLQTTCLRLRGELERFEEEHNQHLKLSLEEMRRTAKSFVGDKKSFVSCGTQTATGTAWSKYFEPNIVKAADAVNKVEAMYGQILMNPLKVLSERAEHPTKRSKEDPQTSQWLELLEDFFKRIEKRKIDSIGNDLLDYIVMDSLPQQVTLKAMSERLSEFFSDVHCASGDTKIVADLFQSVFDHNEQTKLSQCQWETFCEFKKDLSEILSSTKDIPKDFTIATKIPQASLHQILSLLRRTWQTKVDEMQLEIEWIHLKHIIYVPVPDVVIHLPKKHPLRDTLAENHKITFASLIRILIEEMELADTKKTKMLSVEKADEILKRRCQLSCALFKSAFPDTYNECVGSEGLFGYHRFLVEISRFYTKQIQEHSSLLTTKVAHVLQAFIVTVKREVANKVMSRVKAIVKDGANTDMNKISKLLFKSDYSELDDRLKGQMLALLAGVARIIGSKGKENESVSSLTMNLQTGKIIKNLMVECYAYNTKLLLNS